MSLFDEIKRQIQEAMDEAQAEQRGRRPVAPPPKRRPAAAGRPPATAERRPAATEARPPQPPLPAAPLERGSAATHPAPGLRRVLQDRQSLRQTILLAEILDKPKALRRRG